MNDDAVLDVFIWTITGQSHIPLLKTFQKSIDTLCELLNPANTKL